MDFQQWSLARPQPPLEGDSNYAVFKGKTRFRNTPLSNIMSIVVKLIFAVEVYKKVKIAKNIVQIISLSHDTLISCCKITISATTIIFLHFVQFTFLYNTFSF